MPDINHEDEHIAAAKSTKPVKIKPPKKAKKKARKPAR